MKVICSTYGLINSPRQFLVEINKSVVTFPIIKYSYARFLFFESENQIEIEHRFE